MWLAIVATTILSLMGYQSLLAEAKVHDSQDSARADMAAADMATYRSAVINYANTHPAFSSSAVPSTSLSFPTGHVSASSPMWSNYIGGDGTILIYAVVTPPAGLSSAINRLVGDSTMVIETSGATALTTTPLTTVAANALATRSPVIPDVPVWFAHRE